MKFIFQTEPRIIAKEAGAHVSTGRCNCEPQHLAGVVVRSKRALTYASYVAMESDNGNDWLSWTQHVTAGFKSSIAAADEAILGPLKGHRLTGSCRTR